MRSSWLFLPLVVLVACGGSSSRLSSRDKDSDSGGGRRETGGAGGTNGTGGPVVTSGTAGTGSGATGGIVRGGSGGDAGESSAGEPGTGATAGRGGSAGTEATGGTGATGAMPTITSCTEEFPFAGTWEGSVLDFYFEPIEEIRLVVTPDGEIGGYKGSFTWGTGDPPPPVTSGDEPYPDLEFWAAEIEGPSSIDPWPGFPHTVVRGAGCDAVFRVSVSVAEPWEEWCSLQTPIYTDGQGWGCTYLGGGSLSSTECTVQDNNGRPLATYPPWKCFACGTFGPGSGGVCGCTEAGCSFNREPSDTFSFQLGTSGGVDVLSGPDSRCGDCTVRLERAP